MSGALDGGRPAVQPIGDRWWKGTHRPGMKGREIRREFGGTETAYYQRLLAII